MKKIVFYNDNGKIKEKTININEDGINNIIDFSKDTHGRIQDLLKHCKVLLTSTDPIKISQSIAFISSFDAKTVYEKNVKGQIINSIIEDIKVGTIIADGETSYSLNFLKQLKKILKPDEKIDEYEYSERFNIEIDKKLMGIEKMNYEMFRHIVEEEEIFFTEEEAKQYKKRIADSLPKLKR